MTLELIGVSKAFGTAPVLRDVSFTLARGERMAIVGASGSGKSTLLRIIAGFVRPDDGEVRLDGGSLVGRAGMIAPHRRGIGYVAQDGALFPHLTVRQNIAFGLPRRAARNGRVHELAELTSLAPPLLDRYPHQLSGGQQQRVALARALAPSPRVILLDEPFSALDTGLRAATREAMVRALDRSDVTTILVTHDQEESLQFGHQLAVLAAGRLEQAGHPSAVFDAPRTAAVAEFLGAALLLPATADSGCARCALGALAVRHDLSGGASRVRAMIRPSQVRVEVGEGPATGVVESVERRGGDVDLRVRIDGATPVVLHHRLPFYEAGRFPVGGTVQVRVDGGVVLYPDDDRAPTGTSGS
ncbi:ABC transporter ATP-binding protein [Agromyces mangrovi Wang et al. 2018]|uniref:ABC transporter ATP-binding protein n=1 Tax=Agromyces mangrovi TaxID=1858653 RepID=UPI0025747602|nr:ABC transporter ATP-binding protein [Agromyces mangrovi]BDZ63271.1 Fe(3+) ions import ATP-binding protein FbpC [Agromyces mangrovi]